MARAATDSVLAHLERLRKEGQEIFFNRMVLMYGKDLDLTLTEYVNSQTKVKVRCTIHDIVFEGKPNNLGMGKTGCPICKTAKKKAANPNTLTQEEFVAKCREVHGNKYDYSKAVYESAHRKVTIICPEHGEFKQVARSHHKGMGCRPCSRKTMSARQLSNTQEFIEIATEVHGDKYSYELVEYEGNMKPVIVVCPTHGEFNQTPKDHKRGSGCPKCGFAGPSKPETELAGYVKTLVPEVSTSNRQAIAPNELDIYIPEKQLAIEYNGMYYHSEKFIESNYHLDKLKKCNGAGIDLIQVFEDEWEDLGKREIIKSMISSRLGVNPTRIYARNTELSLITAKEARAFLDDNHIQGFAATGTYYALKTKDGELVSVVAFAPPRRAVTKAKAEYDLELVRYAPKKFTTIVGGFSKLLSPVKGKRIVTYCDRRLFNGNGYKAVGFKVVRENPPEYYYLHRKTRNKRHSRLMFQRKHLPNRLEHFDPAKTEHQNMLDNGYRRIYGCGTITLVLERGDT